MRHRRLCLALTSKFHVAGSCSSYQTLRVVGPRVEQMLLIMNAGVPTYATTVFRCTAIPNAQVLAWRSARAAFRSPALTFCVPTFHLSSLHSWQGRGPARSMAAWLNVHLSSQWLVGPLRVSSVPKMGALTHPLLPKRPGLADHRPTPSQSHATAPIRPAATQMGPLLLLGQLRQSHPVSAIFGSGSHSQLQVHRSPRRHWLADLVGERASASAMACRSIANCKG